MDSERTAQAGVSSALLAGGVVLVAINLRPAAASIGPLLERIQSDTGMSPGWAGALATLPVLCFGLLAPLAPVLARRLGLRTAIAGSLCALLAGMVLRLVPGAVLLFSGTAIAGAAIGIGNVLLPVLIRRDFAGRTGMAMAFYATSLIGFAALSAGATVPLANALGGGWRPGLAVWVVPAAAAALAWGPALVKRDRRTGEWALPETPLPHRERAVPGAEAPEIVSGDRPPQTVSGDRLPQTVSGDRLPHTARALLRRPLAWQVTLFFAVQSGGFYATLAWLPSIYQSHGASETRAGLLLSVTMAVGVLTALIIPGLATRSRDQRLLVAVSCTLTAGGLLGILLAPMSAPFVWAVLLGLGQNATFPLALMLVVMRGGSVAATEGLSTLAQSVGYVLAGLAPLVVGELHGLTRSWTPPLILLLALVAPMLATGLGAARDRVLTDRPSAARAAAGP